jgi:hypothetical protein
VLRVAQQAELAEGGGDPVVLGLGKGHRIDRSALHDGPLERSVLTPQERVGAQGISKAAHRGHLGAGSRYHMNVDPVVGWSMAKGAPQHRPGGRKGRGNLGLEAELLQDLGDGRDVGRLGGQ